ncbi:MAG: cobalamin-dependent protein, partial [Clostridium sp.]
LFEAKKLFLPHIMAAAGAMTAAMDILTPELEKRGGSVDEGLGNFVICTIEGDIHSIGKDIVAIMLKVAGFNVFNIGRDIALKDIVQACKDKKAIAVGTSALMTSTMVHQKTFEELLVKNDMKSGLLTNVGGAPVTQKWADEIGADVYSESATDAVTKMVAAVKDSC